MTANPRPTLRRVMTKRADTQPRNTLRRELFIARIAAMKNVLSPNSDTKVILNEDKNAGRR